MIDCPECGARHYPGTLFCDTCGAAVHPAARAHVAATGRVAATAMVTGARSTTWSAAVDREVSLQSDDLRRPPEAAVDVIKTRPLRVRIPHRDVELIVQAALIQVGRADPDAGFAPELDLTPYDGLERGVSRRHATIQWIEDGIVLVDRHSGNGTWLAGTRLVAGYAYQVPPGAEVRFGDLLVYLSIAD